MFTLNSILLLMAGSMALALAVSFARLPFRRTSIEWLALAVVVGMAAATYAVHPAASGYVAFATLTLLVIAPLVVRDAARGVLIVGEASSATPYDVKALALVSAVAYISAPLLCEAYD